MCCECCADLSNHVVPLDSLIIFLEVNFATSVAILYNKRRIWAYNFGRGRGRKVVHAEFPRQC